MQLAGIDLAWSCTRNPTAIAVGKYDDGILHVTHVNASVLTVDGIVERFLDINGLTGVAIDASLIIPNITVLSKSTVQHRHSTGNEELFMSSGQNLADLRLNHGQLQE